MAKIRNILFLHETSLMSGAENSLLILARFLDRARFNPYFALPGSGYFSKVLEASGVKCFPLDYPRVRSLKGVLYTVGLLRKIVKDNNISLIHSNSIRTHIYASIAGLLEKVPVIWHQRNLITTERIDPDRMLMFLPARIICNSLAVAKRFFKRGSIPDKVRVVYTGVDLVQFSPDLNGLPVRLEFGIEKHDFVVGIASRFNVDKGHEVFIEAARILLTQNDCPSDLRFFIVGGAVFNKDKKREDDLRSLVSSIGLESRIIFSGFRSDMPNIYAAMDVLVLASEKEACGRVLFEAMACGKTIVATISGGTPEIVEDRVTGFLYHPNNPGELANVIKKLIIDRDLCKGMGQAARARAEKLFSIEESVKKTEKIYEEVIVNDA